MIHIKAMMIQLSLITIAFFYFSFIFSLIEKTQEEIHEILLQIEDLKSKPVKRYDTIISTVMTGIISIMIGYLMAKLL